MTETSQILRCDLDIQVHEAFKSPNRFNLKKSSSRFLIIKLSKVKTDCWKQQKKHTGEPHKPISGFLSRNLEGQERWDDISVLKERKLSIKNILSGKAAFQKWKTERCLS